jgi:hypothetical protein
MFGLVSLAETAGTSMEPINIPAATSKEPLVLNSFVLTSLVRAMQFFMDGVF